MTDVNDSCSSNPSVRRNVLSVGIDEQIFLFQQTGGISRYFTGLLANKANPDDLMVTPLFHEHSNHHLQSEGIGQYVQSKGPADYVNKYNPDSPRISSSCDIVHSTYYHGFPNLFKDKIHVVSLYDMIPECFPDFFPHGNPHANKAFWLESCNAIVSISQSAAKELVSISPHLAPKVTVIHLGFQRHPSLDEKAESLAKELGWPSFSYYLYVGSRKGYKNGLLLLKAYLRSNAPHKKIHLVCAGGGPPTDSEKVLINSAGLADFVHFLQPTDLDMYLLYNYAQLVVVSSLAEGFSLPLVEALAFDVPLVCSEIPVHAEVAGSYSHLISPLDLSAWIHALSEPEAMKRPSRYLNARYQNTVNYFSFERMVSQHHQFYASLVH